MKRGIIILLLVLGVCVNAQTRLTRQESAVEQDTVATEKKGKEKTLVYLEHSESLSFDEQLHPDAQFLRGNVIFRHDSALMYCDSAYFYEKTNSLDAFGHVRLEQGDTLKGYGDKLYYDGNRRFARFRNNVKLVHNEMQLTTDSLNYDRNADRAWYFSRGVIVDSVNHLTSVWGQYTPYNNQAIFRDSVVLVNDKFTLVADSLKYNTSSNIADLVGETVIVYEEETTIRSTLGWYNTKTEQSMLLRRSSVVHTDGKSLTGDTIFYDKKIGHGRALRNIEMRDTVQKVTLYGNYCEADENDNWGFACDSALLVDWSEADNYSYMHADTLYTEEETFRLFSLVERDSIMIDSVLTAQKPDTMWRDTTYDRVRAYRHVRVYRSDMQMICDSLVYLSKDSTMLLFGSPVCWNDDSQMSAQFITVYVKNGEVDYLHGVANAIAVQQESEHRFDQLAGKELYGYVVDGALRLIDVRGNAQTIVFPQEDDGTFVGMNKTESSFVKLYIKDKKIDYVVFTTATSGVMYPLDNLKDEDTHLGPFFWANSERPKKPGDVFLHPEPTPRPVMGSQSASAVDDTTESDKQDRGSSKGRGGSRKNKVQK